MSDAEPAEQEPPAESDSQETRILGEEMLPVVVWETWEHRVEIPADLQRTLGLPVSILRWSRAKFERVLMDHQRDAIQIERLSVHLRDWSRAGPQPGRSNTWNVFFHDGDRWFVVVISRDQNGSYNVVTVFGTTDTAYLVRRWSQPGFVDREQ